MNGLDTFYKRPILQETKERINKTMAAASYPGGKTNELERKYEVQEKHRKIIVNRLSKLI
jgi:hypothetical protein